MEKYDDVLRDFWNDYYKNEDKIKTILELDPSLAEYHTKHIDMIKPKFKKKQKANVWVKPNKDSLF